MSRTQKRELAVKLTRSRVPVVAASGSGYLYPQNQATPPHVTSYRFQIKKLWIRIAGHLITKRMAFVVLTCSQAVSLGMWLLSHALTTNTILQSVLGSIAGCLFIGFSIMAGQSDSIAISRPRRIVVALVGCIIAAASIGGLVVA